jgi:hypothetical protein
MRLGLIILLGWIAIGVAPALGAPGPEIRAELARLMPIRDRVSVDDLEHRVVVVAFLASWCPPSRPEFAQLNAVKRPMGKIRLAGSHPGRAACWEGRLNSAALPINRANRMQGRAEKSPAGLRRGSSWESPKKGSRSVRLLRIAGPKIEQPPTTSSVPTGGRTQSTRIPAALTSSPASASNRRKFS